MRNDLPAAFSNARQAGDGWIARCPAHDDARSSLSIGRGRDGRWLLKCHAGCELEAILAAAHLEHADLFPDRERQGESRRIVATYPYHDAGGQHLYDVVRYEPKDFRQRRADGVWSMQGVSRVLFGLPALQGQLVVYIVEGEKDVLNLNAIGLVATTNAGGAGKWKDDYAHQLRNAAVEHVVILPDNDIPGRAHAARAAASCHAAGLEVKVVELPELPAKGDVSDWLATGHTKADLVALVKAATLYAPAPAAVTNPGNGSVQEPILVRLADVQPEAVEWIWPGRLARRKSTLLAGDPGGGKSTLATDIGCRISRGAPWPDGGMAPRGKTLVLSAEDGIADTIRPRVDRQNGDPEQIVVLRAIRDEAGERPFNLARDLDRLAEAIAIVQPLLVVIDPISAYLGRTDSHRDAEVRGLLAPLTALLEREGAALLVIAHLSKNDQRAALHRPSGSIAFVAAARIALCLAADPNDPDRRVVAPLKANLSVRPAALAFRIPDGVLTWDAGPVEFDAEALLRTTSPHEREEGTDAAAVIGDLLDDEGAWPMPAKLAIEAGDAHGIPARTMRWTAKRLGIRIERVGFGGKGQWLWHRPIAANSGNSYPEQRNVAPIAGMEEHTGKAAERKKGAIQNSLPARARGAEEVANGIF